MILKFFPTAEQVYDILINSEGRSIWEIQRLIAFRRNPKTYNSSRAYVVSPLIIHTHLQALQREGYIKRQLRDHSYSLPIHRRYEYSRL